MLRQLMSGTSLFDLPVVATAMFVAIFLGALVRVCRKAHAAEYRRMASLPLADDHQTRSER